MWHYHILRALMSPDTPVARRFLVVYFPAHTPSALAAAQVAADKQVFMLAVALALAFTAEELGLSGFEHDLVDDRRHGNRRPFLARHMPMARLCVRVAFAGKPLRFAVIQRAN